MDDWKETRNYTPAIGVNRRRNPIDKAHLDQPSSPAVPTAPMECIVNISEGQRAAVVHALERGIRSVPGVVLLDVSRDPAHNRSVFTFAGTGVALESAVLALMTIAVAAIDLRTHRGQHPRIGAVDVVPFVPLGATSMDSCIALARRVAGVIANRFGVPTYLYGHAARSPLRQRLEDIRRGQFEGLTAKMALPEWKPDFGAARPHETAGATAVGARTALIAYNVDLATDRLDIAKAVAAAVRERDGGLPAVKALGMKLASGRAQVSMNLTDFTRTGLRAAFARVLEEARARGVDVADSELIGLAPAAALDDAIARDIRLRDFSRARILEERLGD